ncbi:DUF6585 family protein [Gemmata sp. JC717]|uniref:DUF3137 domain-containing protein n=1 Tax=Gemmata algarum TaxID=2975278 RepID=A0ABU5F7W3_9BACT|nr:DUF6585 family protein [Gemmata algarum]MDY3555374.1 DUF6585 family protein [Gemmata algarum]MDY3563691.1 hypothetical protein [Gemmata algarum]
MDLPDDDHLQRAVTELGDPDAFFRIGPARFFTKLSLGVALLVYGAVANYLWWAHGPATFGHVELLLLVFLPLSGASLLLHMYRNRGLYVLVYPTGLLRLRRGEVDSFPWAEVERVHLKVQRADDAEYAYDDGGEPLACWLPVDVPTFKLWDAGLTVTRGDGVEAHFGPALTDYDALAAQVQTRSFAALWPRARDRFLAGERLEFGELELDLTGLRHGGKLLPWRELKELTVAQGKLSVKQSGKWLPWALTDVFGVPNPHVLFALVAEARRAARAAARKSRARRAGRPSEE